MKSISSLSYDYRSITLALRYTPIIYKEWFYIVLLKIYLLYISRNKTDKFLFYLRFNRTINTLH